MVEPFAEPSDVEARWRPLSDSEVSVAEVLLQDASDMVFERWPNVLERVAAGTVAETALTRVVANMVKRAMNSPLPEGMESFTEARGPFTFGGKATNPNGNLYISAEVVSLLDGHASQRRKAFSVDLTSPAPGDCW